MMSDTLTKTLTRFLPDRKPVTFFRVRFVYLQPTEYVQQGYQPIRLHLCLRELRRRGVQHGFNHDEEFWFDQARMNLTPGLLASLYFHFPKTHPDRQKDFYDDTTGDSPFS